MELQGVIVVIGANYESYARRVYSEINKDIKAGKLTGLSTVIGASHVANLKMPFQEMPHCQLHFEHHIPGRVGDAVSQDDIDAWINRLFQSKHEATCGNPKVDFIADASSAHITAIFTWPSRVTPDVVLRSVKLLEDSYIANGGIYQTAKKKPWWKVWSLP